MIKLNDLVTLAKAGWTPKATKEVLSLMNEIEETDPKKSVKVEDDDVKVVDKPAEGGEEKKDEVPPVEDESTDDIAELIKLLKED